VHLHPQVRVGGGRGSWWLRARLLDPPAPHRTRPSKRPHSSTQFASTLHLKGLTSLNHNLILSKTYKMVKVRYVSTPPYRTVPFPVPPASSYRVGDADESAFFFLVTAAVPPDLLDDHSGPRSRCRLKQQAVAVLKGDSSVSGVITFTQESEGSPITVTGDVSRSELTLCTRLTETFRSRTLTPMPSEASTSSE
jgi:hypothetical protein